MTRIGWLLFGALACGLAYACLNDSDSLAMEASGLPDVVDVIAGRFDRNPPLYYEMRLARVVKELETSPNKLILFDDACVACDRLGQGDEAIAWMDKKRKAMEKQGLPENDDDWYRYYANIGTVRAHKWLRRGGKADDVHLLKQAYEEIKRSVEIKPEAHFGREWVQLDLMGDILFVTAGTRRTAELQKEHKALMSRHMPGDEFDAAPKKVEGLTGIVVLGSGWDSEKIWGELWMSLSLADFGRLTELAQYRWAELGGAVHVPTVETQVSRAYRALRDNGEGYTKHRLEFMQAKLEKGQHPDTHPDFWTAYKEVPRIDLEKYSYKPPAQPSYRTPIGVATLSISIATVLGLGAWAVIRRKRRKSSALQ